MFKTTNGGTSCTNISGNLPNIVVNEIMLKQGQPAEFLFAATELGVYYTENGGTSWAKLGQSLPNANVRDIEIHYTADKLVAGTFGRGLWEISIANNTLGTNDNTQSDLAIGVYPNPAVDKIQVKIPTNASGNDYKYVIYNVVGGIIKQGQINTSNAAIDK